ncbi:MAG TPA: hypothetical protein VGW80_09320 [Solirubrobacterales bacterium]|jgi:hypothetical protein|nr:hypothetical protein [Solirubrobacterales bacterium]
MSESFVPSIDSSFVKRWIAIVGLSASALAVFVAVCTSPAKAALPDGRVYEMVSPVVKDGSAAGATNEASNFAYASPDGSRILYRVNGPVGETSSGYPDFVLATRGSTAWSSRAAFPRAGVVDILEGTHEALFPSLDLTSIAWASLGPNSEEVPPKTPGIYRSLIGGPATWLSKPLLDPSEADGPELFEHINIYTQAFTFAGGDQDLDPIYFSYLGRLLPEDSVRAANVEKWINGETGNPAPGFYEYRGGQLAAAGVLPDGTMDPYGAVPAAVSRVAVARLWEADALRNQVSADGSGAFFLSPPPESDSPDPPQLYVRIDGSHTELVSRTEGGATAPSGVTVMKEYDQEGVAQPYAFASEDGSVVAFKTTDSLTLDAPAGGEKFYLFHVDSQQLEYLPGVDGTIVGAARDGSRLLFVDGTGTALKIWEGGSVTTVAPLESGAAFFSYLGQVIFSDDGSVIAFNSNLVGGVNDGDLMQGYRYDSATHSFECLSCPPDGQAATGNALMGTNNAPGSALGFSTPAYGEMRNQRAMSTDGEQVFFDTDQSLTPLDTNGKRDVYRWRDGQVALITSGRSSKPSYFLDNSASGNDVFFSTTESIDPADTDGGADVYDARVGGGFPQPNLPAACLAGCQGTEAPPQMPALGSATFAAPKAVKHRHKRHRRRHGHGKKHKRQNKHRHSHKGGSSK